jgi:hypothetical protein
MKMIDPLDWRRCGIASVIYLLAENRAFPDSDDGCATGRGTTPVSRRGYDIKTNELASTTDETAKFLDIYARARFLTYPEKPGKHISSPDLSIILSLMKQKVHSSS